MNMDRPKELNLMYNIEYSKKYVWLHGINL
jgi:hypothetical protein